MRSTSVTSPILTLNYDALSEVAKRLPAVGSEKPWRDLNSLALTCVRLRQWKKKVVDNYVEIEWKRVSAEVAQTSGWRDSLEKILSDFEHPSRRWFREPILRKITKAEKKSTTAKPITSVSDFNASLYKKRETVSLKEISWCLLVCADKQLEKNKKIELVTKLPSFLTERKSIDRQKALRMMFKLLDNDKKLGQYLKKNGTFKKIEHALEDDPRSQILLKLGLHIRNLLSAHPDVSVFGCGLESIPDEERWPWVLHNLPECLNTMRGMRVMLNDSACRKQMIDFLSTSFLECKDDFERFKFIDKVSTVYPMFRDCNKGKKLTKNLSKWFLKTHIIFGDSKSHLFNEYMNLLIQHINFVKIYFGKKEKKLLSKAMYEAIAFTFVMNAYQQWTLLLSALAKDNLKLFKKFIIYERDLFNKKTLFYMLDYSDIYADIEFRRTIITSLRTSVIHNFSYDRLFVSQFTQMADMGLRRIAESEKKIEEFDSAASES